MRVPPAGVAWAVPGSLLALVALAAQLPPATQPAPQPTFRAGTELVRVDVTVTTRDGQPVTDLGPEDFLVFEDDLPQTVQSFKFLRLDGTRAPDNDEALEIRSVEHARAEAARDDVHVFAIFLDDYHVSRGRNTLVVREALTRWIRQALGPTDLVVLMDPLTPLDALTFTRDRHKLVQAIQAFEGRRGIYVPARSLLEEQQQLSRDIRRVRIEVTLSALEALVTHLGSLKEGRKSVLFVSEGFIVPPELMEDVRRVYEAANRGNTAIYTLDPRGLLTGPASGWQDVLRVLADNTGGRAIVSYNRFDEPLNQMVRDASALYLLGYTSTQAPMDGKFHRIEVRVKRKGLEVRARRGYWAPSSAELTQAREAVATQVPPEVTAALATLAAPRGGHDLVAWLGVGRSTPGQMRVTVSWEFRRKIGDGVGRPASVTMRAADPSGRVVFEGRRPVWTEAETPASHGATLPPGHLAFDAPAGPLTVALTLEGPDGPLDTVRREVEVADLWKAPLALATPRLFRVRSPAELHALAAAPDPTPVAEPVFDRTTRLIVALAAYCTSGAPVDLTAALFSRQGQPLARLPLAPTRIAGATDQLDLPLQRFAAGDYVIRIDARAGVDTATALVAIRVR